ncbi:hypothetical protein B0T20DRAFT_339055, partial [Sordaria brevicollis]
GAYMLHRTNKNKKPYFNPPQHCCDWSNSRRDERMGLHGICAAPCALSLWAFLAWLPNLARLASELGLPSTIPGSPARHTREKRGRGEGIGPPPFPLHSVPLLILRRRTWHP